MNNQSALVQVMAWHLLGAKPLPEPMLTQIYDVMPHTLYIIPGMYWIIMCMGPANDRQRYTVTLSLIG